MSQFIDFRCELDRFTENFKEKIEINIKKIEELLNIEDKNFENFVGPLQIQEELLSNFFTPLSNLNSVKNCKKTQDIYSQSLMMITEYSTDISQNLELYKSYKEIEEKESESLNYEQQRVLKLNIDNFEQSGANLDEDIKIRLKEINIKLSELSNTFSQNVLDATNKFKYIIKNKKDLDGLSSSDIKSAKFKEDGKTRYKFTLQMPSYIAYMTNGKNQKIRKKLYKAYVSRAPQNAKIIDEILKLKYEMSNLLGYKNYASYSLASKMAKDEKTVFKFLNKLIKKSKNQASIEIKELKNIADKKIHSYDTAFYSEVLKKEKYKIDEEKYKPYLEQTNVVKGTLLFLNSLFDIEFKKIKLELWDKKAFAYDIYKDGKIKARLYFDLEAREHKQGGAWMNNLQTHYKKEDGTKQLASALVVCNFQASSKKNPSLLRHDDVVTLFHEMGHALHHVLSSVNECEVSGVNGVQWDAVEFPSQFLENFAYEKDVLKLFAKHYKTNKKLPKKMINKLIKNKNFLSAISMQRQLEFSLFDFKLHSKLYQGDDIQKLLDKIREETSLVKTPSYNKFQNGFSHIFAGGYSAGYYSYKWAEVLSADVFYSVLEDGIFNSVTAKKYYENILLKGGSKSMNSLFEELMGREVNPTKLLKLNGIK